jgi:hypothetical protein
VLNQITITGNPLSSRTLLLHDSKCYLLILNKHSGSYFILYFILIVISYNEALFLSYH